MRISIRSDYCIALRMIALQELQRQNEEFLNKILGGQDNMKVRYKVVICNKDDFSNEKPVAFFTGLDDAKIFIERMEELGYPVREDRIFEIKLINGKVMIDE